MRSSLSCPLPGVKPQALLVQEARNRFGISRPSLRVSVALFLYMGCGETGVLLVSDGVYSLLWIQCTAMPWTGKTLVQRKMDPLLPSWAEPLVLHRAQKLSFAFIQRRAVLFFGLWCQLPNHNVSPAPKVHP